MTVKFGCFTLFSLAALVMSGSTAFAVTTTANLAVSATVLDTCIVTTGVALAFAAIAPSSNTSETAPSSIVLVCTASRTGLTVALGGGSAASAGMRRMADGLGNFLPYVIDSDASHAAPIAVNGNIYSGGITAAVPVTIPVYGQIPTGNYASGVYTDTVLVTLNY